MASLTRDQQNSLVESAKAGSQEAYNKLHAFLRPILMRTLSSIAPEGSLEDVVHETLTSSFLKLPQFRGDSSFASWAVQIGINISLSHRRKLRQEAKYIAGSVDEAVNLYGVHDAASFHDRTVEVNATHNLIHNGIASLGSDMQRRALMMQLSGFSQEQMAAILGCPVNSVKSYLHRAKEALRAILLKQGVQPEDYR